MPRRKDGQDEGRAPKSRGKGKGKVPTRGHQTWRTAEEIEAENKLNEENSSEESSEEEEEEENSDSEEEEEKEKKKKGVEGIIETESLNRNSSANKLIKASELDVEAAPQQLSRREREEQEKKLAKKRYMKAYADGRIPEARADLARLQRIRKEREAAAKRKEEEEKARNEKKKVARERNLGRKK